MTADGSSLFIGESGLSGSAIYRFDVRMGALLQIAKSNYDDGYGFPYPSRAVMVSPDGDNVYYASYCLDGATLTQLRYAQSDRILSIGPDSVFGVSATRVYDLATGGVLATLPSTCAAQALSPDGATLYCAASGAITTADLSMY